MSNNDCNDISLLTANTGLRTISEGNPYLNGTGAISTVLTAGENGTIIKSVTIKSVPTSFFGGVSQQGMVRLYIQSSGESPVTTLYKEVPIPAVLSAPCISLPMPVYSSFETVLIGNLKLQSGYSLVASTQFADTFNIIVEGLDWNYPDSPTVCCNFEEEIAITGVGNLSAAYDGTSATIVDILTADGDVEGATYLKFILPFVKGNIYDEDNQEDPAIENWKKNAILDLNWDKERMGMYLNTILTPNEIKSFVNNNVNIYADIIGDGDRGGGIDCSCNSSDDWCLPGFHCYSFNNNCLGGGGCGTLWSRKCNAICNYSNYQIS